ncbi:spermidine/purescine ABC transporter permease, partial [Lactiplantibacillus plantarum]
MTLRNFKWRNLYLWLVFIVLYAPIIFLVVYSFSQGTTFILYHAVASDDQHDLFVDSRLIAIFLDTIFIAILSSLLETVIGFGYLAAVKRPHERGSRNNDL